jgi:hypothetical protein
MIAHPVCASAVRIERGNLSYARASIRCKRHIGPPLTTLANKPPMPLGLSVPKMRGHRNCRKTFISRWYRELRMFEARPET